MKKTTPGRSGQPVFIACIMVLLIITGCSDMEVDGSPTSNPAIESITATEEVNRTIPAPSSTASPTLSITPTSTAQPSATENPTKTATPTITVTPTSEYPVARVLMQANCRYGPGKAYLYSHGLYDGDRAEIHGRNYGSTWLWIKPEQIDRHCWVAASVVEVTGDLESVLIAVNTRLPYTTFINPPELVQAVREGDQVVVSWSPVIVKPAEDGRGYLIEASICQNGVLISVAVHTDSSSYTFQDEKGCSGKSSGKIYAVEKHGYTDPVTILWP